MSRPSPHLTWRELACRDGTAYPERWRGSRAIVLADAFETIRAAWGGPIRVTSAYRTPEHNRRIGGARHSQHVQGRALDLQPAIGGTAALLRLKLLVRELIREGHLPWVRGIGYYRTFVHIDTRSSARLVVWHGAGAKDDVRV